MLRFVGLFVVVLLVGSANIYAEVPANSANADALSLSPSYLSDTAEPLDLHGYVETQLKTAHITPRGLIIADRGVEVQPAAGLIFDFYKGTGLIDKASLTVGVWNSVNTSLDIPSAGTWFEIDYLAKLSLQIANRINFSAQYIAFDSPGGQFSTDNNLEFTLSYDDTDLLAPHFGLHPYTRLFYNVSGSSTTLLGRNGNTYDVELGLVPTYVWKPLPNYLVTFTLPTYVTVGPKNFWGGNQHVGVLTTSLGASIPMAFIPSRLGRWHLDASVSYFNLLNGKLVDAANTLGNGRDRSRVVGEIGMGVDF